MEMPVGCSATPEKTTSKIPRGQKIPGKLGHALYLAD